MFSRKRLFIVTAIVEVATGLGLLLVPSVVFGLLLGASSSSPETLLVGRVAGAALLAIGVSCWPGRNDPDSASQRGLLFGVLVYDVAAFVVLGYAGFALRMVGVLLWPAVALHGVLAVWCVRCIRQKPRS